MGIFKFLKRKIAPASNPEPTTPAAEPAAEVPAGDATPDDAVSEPLRAPDSTYEAEAIAEAEAPATAARSDHGEAVAGHMPEPAPEQPSPQPDPEALLEPPSERLEKKLEKTRSRFGSGLLSFFTGNKPIDDDLLEELETQLIMSDIGVATAQKIMAAVKINAKKAGGSDESALRNCLREELIRVLTPIEKPLEIPDDVSPYVILVVGVNGAGKTTTIGKIARQLQNGGKSVILAAGDTFRAAAVEQLKEWGTRNNVTVISQGSGADSASVIFDAMQAAKARGIDVLIADTAGRLHTQSGLMDELGKVSRVIKKIDPAAPHETLLVLDGTTGQNGLSQGRQFQAAVAVSGLAITKLDGTAKGGVLFTMADELDIPIRFIGVGEGIYDLRVFDAVDFVDALLSESTPDGSART